MEWHKDSVNSNFLYSHCWTCAFSHILEHCSSICTPPIKSSESFAHVLPVLSFSKQDVATSARVQVQLWTKNSDPFYFLAWFQHTFVWFYLAAYLFRFQIIEHDDFMRAKIIFDFMMPRLEPQRCQMHQAAPPVFQRLSQKCVERLRLESNLLNMPY